MAVDMFLKLGDIKGESRDSKHKDEIDVLSWSWGASNAGSMALGGGGGAGKVDMQDFNFTMTMNRASPKLVEHCADGKHIKEAVLTCRKAGGDQMEYLIIKFTDVLISSYQTGSSGGTAGLPTESVALNYGKVEFNYTGQKDDGSKEGVVSAGWDVKANKKV